MSFLAMQTAIAKMCVDYAFRQSFLRDPDEALASCDLTADESEAVKAIDLKAIQAYADSLVNKKMALVTKWFPLSLAALRKGLPGGQLRRIVFSYGYQGTRDNSELGGEWVRGEFVRFKKYLQDLVSKGEIAIPFFTDVLEFEAARQMMSQDPTASKSREEPGSEEAAARVFGDAAQNGVKPLLGKHVSVRRFNCDIVALISETEKDEKSETPVTAEPMWAMFVKKPGTSKVVVQTISPPLRDVLELCDGTRTTGEILALIVSRHATPAGPPEEEVKSDCLTVLEQFYTAGLMGGVLWYGASQVISQQLTIGELLAFSVYLGLLLQPAQFLAGLNVTLQQAFAALDRVLELLNLIPEDDHDETKLRVGTIEGKVTFEHVSFSYDGEGPPLAVRVWSSHASADAVAQSLCPNRPSHQSPQFIQQLVACNARLKTMFS